MSKPTLPTERASHIAVFQEQTIRRTWHNEEWWFSVADVCGVLTESADPGAYWRKLKQRLAAEGSEVVTHRHGLKERQAGGEPVELPGFDAREGCRIHCRPKPHQIGQDTGKEA